MTRTARARRSTVRRSISSVVAAALVVIASAAVGVTAFVLSTGTPAQALVTYGPITSISLSTSTVTESGVAYQLAGTEVPNATASTALVATFSTGTATWVNGAANGALTSNVAATVPLAVGWNTIAITHTSADLATDTTYTIRMFRGGEFTNLTFTTPGATLTPAWSKDTFAYTLPDVPYETQTLTFTVQSTRDEPGALNCDHCGGWLYHSRGTMTASLDAGDNVLDFTLFPTADSYNDPIHYLVTVHRGTAFGPARLTGLTFGGATPTPAAELYHFTASEVGNATASTPVVASFSTGTAAWVNGAANGALTSNVAATVPLAVGWNTITVTHTSADLATDTTYTIRMFRGGEFTDLTFTTPGATLTPAWSKDTFAYTLPDVPYETQTLTFTVQTTRDEAGALNCDQCDWWLFHSRGTMTAFLDAGENILDFTLFPTADSYNDPIHYLVTVHRGTAFEPTRLTELRIPDSTLTADATLYAWTASQVSNATVSTPVVATFSTGTAAWANGASTGALSSGVAATVPLTVGWNTITVTHTSADLATDTTYTIRMFRGGEFTDLTFTSPGATLTPAWSKDTHVYALPDVPYETQTLAFTVQTTRDEAGTLECDHCDWWLYHGRGSLTATLQPGANCMNFKFYAGSGYYEDRVDYWVSINRGPVVDPPACPAVVPTTTTTTTTPPTTSTSAPTTDPPVSSTSTPPSTTHVSTPPSATSTSTSEPSTSTSVSADPTTTERIEPTTSTIGGIPDPPAPPIAVIEALPDQTLSARDVYAEGQTVTVTAGGFAPGELVQLIVASTPTVIASGYADAAGSITLTGALPTTLALGDHTLAVWAPDSSLGAQQAIVVQAGPGRLPATGGDVPRSLELALAALMVGSALLVTFRRDRRRGRRA